jgi:hypothetical protein
MQGTWMLGKSYDEIRITSNPAVGEVDLHVDKVKKQFPMKQAYQPDPDYFDIPYQGSDQDHKDIQKLK